MKYSDKTYFYRKNAQGDIIQILDSDGVSVVKFICDAWGNYAIVQDTSGINLGELNPFRYRRYYYDAETGLHFLKTRYYNSEINRYYY